MALLTLDHSSCSTASRGCQLLSLSISLGLRRRRRLLLADTRHCNEAMTRMESTIWGSTADTPSTPTPVPPHPHPPPLHLTSQNQHPFFAIGFKQYHTSESRSASSIGKRRILSLCSQADPSLFVHINLSTHLCSHYNPSTPFAPFPNWKTEKYNIVK